MNDEMNFGDALMGVMQGFKVARKGWNGADQWVMRVDSEGADIEGYPLAPCLALKNARGVMQLGWAPSQGDMFATDWVNVGHGEIDRAHAPSTTKGPVAPNPDRPLSFGETAVGLSFNPSNDPAVVKCKQGFADLIDQMHNLCAGWVSGEQARHASVAITMMEDAQMRCVKALTWKD